MSNDKTLATAKHGGSVQLPTSTNRVDADTLWWLQDAASTLAEGGNESHAAKLHELHAALSAQPSPGGQGDALAEAARRVLIEVESRDFDGGISDATYAALHAALAARQPDTAHAAYRTGKAIGRREAELEYAARQPVGVSSDTLRALADRWASGRDYNGSPVDDIRALIDEPTSARQPVGEPVAWLLISEAGSVIGATRHARERESWEAAGGTTEPLYATPRVQNVDGYQAAFYELADMLGIPAQPCAPKVVWEAQMRPALQAAIAAQGPVPMVLHCPRCHLQHIDAPDERTPGWENPPHRSHLCHGCGLIWRPADVPTIGVEHTHTTGKKDTPLTMPLLTVDLGQFRDAVMHAYGVIEPEEYCVKLGELLDLIDAKAVGNGQSVGMDDLEQILLDPENQPSQFGTVPTELLEKCEGMISDLVHQFGDRGCTCTFPEADCCAYARAEHYSRDGAAHG